MSALPARIGPFELKAQIGTSAMGELYRGLDVESRDSVVIAVAHDPNTPDGHNRRMRREALTLFEMSHVNLLSVRDVGALDGRLYVIMDSPAGQPIDQFLRARPGSWRRVLRLFSDAGRGLAAAHTRAVVHGAVTPACILVADDERVRVTNFALVRSRSADLARDPDDRRPYLAPERASGAPATIFGDQYSFATAVVEILHAQSWWTRRRIPRTVTRALRRARAEQPSKRYPSMYQLLDAMSSGSRD